MQIDYTTEEGENRIINENYANIDNHKEVRSTHDKVLEDTSLSAYHVDIVIDRNLRDG